MSDQISGNEIQSFCEVLCSTLIESLSAANASSWQIASAPPELPTIIDSERLQVTLAFEGNLHGELILEFDRASASMLLEGPIKESDETRSQELLRLINLGVTSFCSKLSAKYGVVRANPSITSASIPGDFVVEYLTAIDEAARCVPIVIALSPVMARTLNSHAKAAMLGTAGEPTHPTPDPINLDLVMDVELEVTLRFGQRLLTLREIFDLTSGTVIELDRQVEEPVELLLEGKVIARGEAVVIDGNYGLRVTDVPRPISNEMLCK